MKKLFTYFMSIFLLSQTVTMAQDTLSYKEQVYLHTDQQTYLTGEYLWFSAYLLDAQTQKFSDLSKVLYVELLDRKNKPVLQTKIGLEGGSGDGSMYLPASLSSDYYRIRAYTRWMRNGSPADYFHGQVRVFNPFIPLQTAEDNDNDTDELIVELQPEGNSLVNGLTSKVSFQVTENGKGIPFRGMLISSRQDTILRFIPQRAGMGNFEFVPEEGVDYRAEIRNVYDSLLITVQLPRVKAEGFVVAALPKLSGYSGTVSCTCLEGDRATVSVERGQIVYASYPVIIRNGLADFRISRSDMPAGVSHLIVRDETGAIRAQRPLFRMPDHKSADITLEKSEAGLREKLSFRISTDSATRISVSVYRADALTQPTESQLLQQVYLTSMIPGNIDSPEFYFSGTDQAASALEDLMIIRGNKKNSRSDTRFYLPEYRGQILMASVTDPSSNQGVSNVPVYASLAGQPYVFRVGLSDAQGIVRFQARDLQGVRSMVMRPANLADTVLKITSFPYYSREYGDVALPRLTAEENLKNSLEMRSLGMQMENIYHGEDKSRTAPVKSDTLPFYGEPHHTYYLDDYTRFPSMLDVMKEYVYSVAARKRNDKYIFRVFDELNNQHFDKEPLVLLDGVAVMDTDKLIKYDPLLVERIDVIAGTYIYGPMSFPGIVSFSTYKGTMEGFSMPDNVLIEEFDGLQYERKFFIPDYDNLSEMEKRKPDMRHQLYWNPNMKTGGNGSITDTFYTSDVPGNYIIHVEGITQDGIPVSGIATFEVKTPLYSEK